MRLFSKVPQLLMLVLLVLPMVMVSENALARAEEDELEEEEEGVVEEEEGAETGEETAEETPEEDDGKKTTSADADTTILFTKPPGTSNLGMYKRHLLSKYNKLCFHRAPRRTDHRISCWIY